MRFRFRGVAELTHIRYCHPPPTLLARCLDATWHPTVAPRLTPGPTAPTTLWYKKVECLSSWSLTESVTELVPLLLASYAMSVPDIA
eukprot:560901-Rhodomonas_salina.2